MADGIPITAGSGTTVATDDTGATGHVQLFKLAYSADGSPLLSLATDAQAQAEWIVGTRKDPQLRFDRMVLLPSALT